MNATARSGPKAASRAWHVSAAVAAALALSAPGSHAAGAPAWASLGVTAGSTQVDGRLSRYAWDTAPRAAFGAFATAGRGPLELGLRAWRSSTVQHVELPGASVSPAVRSTTLELLARAHVATVLGTRASVQASAGRLRLDYRPSHLSIVPDGLGTPIDVTFAPVSEWVAGGGVALRHALPGRFSAGLAVDRQFFALDTAHRRGSEIVYSRESFGDWSARLELARLFSLGTKGASR